MREKRGCEKMPLLGKGCKPPKKLLGKDCKPPKKQRKLLGKGCVNPMSKKPVQGGGDDSKKKAVEGAIL